MIRNARHLALGAACLLLAGCGTTQTGAPVGADQRTAPSSAARSGPTDATEPAQAPPVKDATTDIDGVLSIQYRPGIHVPPDRRVAYDHLPPLGGAHDDVWAACNGVVYPKAVRTENLVHSLEHGAVWISYNPDEVKGADLATLVKKIDGKPYSVMSPFPGQRKPISVQSWGKQLQVDQVTDPRIDKFIAATRANPYLTPEPGASCDPNPTKFDQDDPPPFDPSDPGPDGVPVNAHS
ncbi:DUF3105 domain-containing protein [Actinokineospora enzanensis]|uniref:DUF3105 domain-containing protein n=1 Tax=Actinokineospora enzanensis TaxID=155975 RepID=UPI0003761AE2|nr:DUF3105 domain-containing protein [Actinokineospora enzanensis]